MGEWFLESSQYELLLEGAWITIQILIYSFALGVVLSLLFGVARLSEREWVRGAAFAYVEFARGISSIVLLFIMAIALPVLLGIRISQEVLIFLGSLALGLNMGGYGAEIVRGSILAIPKGQTEATIALNLTPTQRLRYVILPQAMRIILPPMGNLTIEILKGTALVSLIGITDLMQSTRNIRQQQLAAASATDLTVLFVNTLLIYFVMSQIVATVFRYFEGRLDRRYEARNEPLPADMAAPMGAEG
jgi:polar amino acid transport system permease protein